MPEISIIIPAMNEEKNIPNIYDRLVSVLNEVSTDYEIIIVDDGSTDDTWGVIEKLHEHNNNIVGIKLSRNFGHQNALMAGLHISKGDAVITMDADLQHPPEIVPQLLELWKQSFKIVNTIRIETKKVTFLKRFTSRMFYNFFSLITNSTIRHGMADFRLLDRQVVDEIKSLNEIHIFLRGLIQWTGFASTEITFKAPAREGGRTKYTWRRMFGLALAGITSFTILPLRLSVLLGLFTAVLSFIELCYVLFIALIKDTTVPGWASTIVVISFLFGILFIILGVIGEYIGRIFEVIRKRPIFIIEKSL